MRSNLAAVFLLITGFASGAASAALYHHGHARSVTDIPTRTEQLDAMADEVELDPSQRARAHAISDRSHDDLTKLRQGVAPQIAAIRSQVRSELRALMTPEQQKKFDAYCARRDEQRAHQDD